MPKRFQFRFASACEKSTPLFTVRRRLTSKQKLNILWCTYHSLTDFSAKKAGPSAVGRQLNLNKKTVHMFLTRFAVDYNFNVEQVLAGRR